LLVLALVPGPPHAANAPPSHEHRKLTDCESVYVKFAVV
jgi:hypothetical protein